jgi:hypothetical protein
MQMRKIQMHHKSHRRRNNKFNPQQRHRLQTIQQLHRRTVSRLKDNVNLANHANSASEHHRVQTLAKNRRQRRQ